MANRSDEQVWISVTLQHLNKLWWTGNTLTSKLKNTGPLVIDFVLVKAFKTRKYIENSRMTKQYERQWRAPVKPGESKRYSTHQNIHEENKQKVFFFPLHQLSHNVSKSTLPLHWVHPKYKHKMTFFWPHKAVWWLCEAVIRVAGDLTLS